MPVDNVPIYFTACRYMLHAPVLQQITDSGEVRIVPLNPLPEGVDLSEHVNLPELFELSQDSSLLKGVYECSHLPLTRQPMSSLEIPPVLFAELNFEKHPVKCQPKMCLVNWLRARSLEIQLSTPRDVLERHVFTLLRLQQPIAAVPLKPIVGQHDGYFAIRPRTSATGAPEEDHWQMQFVDQMKLLEGITDDVIDRYLGEKRRSRPSIRNRVKKLIDGGFYDIKSIKSRKMEKKVDGTPCILLCINCLSSKTSVMHTVYSVFEDKPDGRYILDVSSCSCKKGEWFCSHSIAFLYLVGIVQRCVETESQLLENYCNNPLLVQGVLMLIENIVVTDKFKYQWSQRKQQRNA